MLIDLEKAHKEIIPDVDSHIFVNLTHSKPCQSLKHSSTTVKVQTQLTGASYIELSPKEIWELVDRVGQPILCSDSFQQLISFEYMTERLE